MKEKEKTSVFSLIYICRKSRFFVGVVDNFAGKALGSANLGPPTCGLLTKPCPLGDLSVKISGLCENVDKTVGFGALLLTKSAKSGVLSAKNDFLVRFVNKVGSEHWRAGL